ncbi:hypothetical protein D9619_012291 [Psilocybe cf. subviscida]|uniref:HAT C-terminal dimerisation domain-containing protein n=1 Tax=Psilocybe cf. subviscida TaxID=2480587 RepID=A0A8H5ER44_9AGAR|nr:hypothetical protein D9619_012291 [Psilocybe cf. subviscida]
MKAKWRSPVYAFFKPTPMIRTVKGRRAHTFECLAKSCLAKGADPRYVNRYLDTGDVSSTSNLRKHARICFGEQALTAADDTNDIAHAREVVKAALAEQAPLTAMFERMSKGKGKVTYSHTQHTKTEVKEAIVRWVTENHRPFNIVSDEWFLMLMKTGRPTHYIPSPATVSRDVKNVFVRCRERIAKMLQEYDGELNFATDAWTSPNDKALIAISVHFELKGEPASMLLDLVEVARSHSGVNLAEAFSDVLHEFGIENKMLSVCCDNASNMDTFTNELPALVPSFAGEAARTRCFAHIVNLTAKALLRQFDVPKKDADDALDDAARELRQLASNIEAEEQMAQGVDEAESDDEDGWVDYRDEMTEAERKKLEKCIAPMRLLLVKLRKIAFTTKRSSTLILPRWYELVAEFGLRRRKMPRDVLTRWNSTYDMLEFAIEYREVIDAITDERDMKMRKYELDDTEWKIAEELRDILLVFKDATLFFSRANSSLANVIPSMDLIDEKLATAAADDSEYSLAIRASATVAKRLMNKYYSATDLSEVYRISMVLHPRHKLQYFKKAGWTDAWIADAKKLVVDAYELKYKTYSAPLGACPQKKKAASLTKSKSKGNMFDDHPGLAPLTSEAGDEIERYLLAGCEDVKDGLMWWYEHRHTYPRLSRMARDYLSIPPTSVNVERVFSQGRILLSHLRNRLSSATIRASMCVGEWSRMGFVRTQDITATAVLEDVEEGEDEYLELDWDKICI